MAGKRQNEKVVRLTYLRSAIDFEVGPGADVDNKKLADQLYMHLSRTPVAGREMVECREHDSSCDHELAARRDPMSGRVEGIYVYLRKLGEGTPSERWCVVHFDGRASHVLPVGKSKQHQREQDAWAQAADAAGYRAEQEVRLTTGVRCDLLIYGPEAHVDIEVQRSHIKVASAQARTRSAVRGGAMPIWSTDHQTDWTRRNAVPHIRTNELPEWHSPRDHWVVVGGVRDVVAERCSPLNFHVCPDTGQGKFCGRHHAKLTPKLGLRVYEVAEQAPAGGLVILNTGKGTGSLLVTPEHRDLWNELTRPPGRPVAGRPLPTVEPLHRQHLRPGFGAVIDQQRSEAAAAFEANPDAPVSPPDGPKLCSKCGSAPRGPGGVLCPPCVQRLSANQRRHVT